MMKRLSNYDKLCRQWRERFLKMDQQQLMEKLPELKPEGDYLTICHFGRKYGVHRQTGEIVPMGGNHIASNTVKLNIYTLFGYVSSLAKFKDNWVSFEDLKGTSPFAAAFKKGIIEPFARTFSGNIDRLQFAMEAMGGKKLPYSDMGYQVDAFKCIPVRFLFWEGDDEFPPQANMLFDSSATDFIHGESIVSIAMVGLAQLAEIAGLPLDKSALPLM
ncbi:MAG: DUF3786 domain-containing protein [Clostridiales bacterium]|nr:DUF3786 domain-containing protein [Clostridiales bacterium]